MFDRGSNQILVPFEWRYDDDGTVWVKIQAHDDLTAKTPYGIVVNEYGYITQALPAAGVYILVGVPANAIDSGDEDWVQIGGYVASLITASLSMAVGHGLTVNSGAIADIGADYSGAAGEFAVAVTETTTSTTQNVVLVPKYIITI
jgi:hypothetical protein